MTMKAILNTGLGATVAISDPIAMPTMTAGRPLPHHVGQHRAGGAVREIGADIGRRHDRERGADAELHVHRVRHAEDAEHLVEHRHRDHAAADPEQSGEQAGDHAAREDGGGEQREFSQRHAEHAILPVAASLPDEADQEPHEAASRNTRERNLEPALGQRMREPRAKRRG